MSIPITRLNNDNRVMTLEGCRRGFTLVELLVVLTVMVTLGGMLTYALTSAQTDARIKRTEADVLTISQLLQTRANEIALSRVNLVYGATGNNVSTITGPGSPASTLEFQTFASAEQARLILLARRDLMRMVMPECRADLLYPPASLQFRGRVTATAWIPGVAQLRPPAQWNAMRTLAGLDSAETLDTFFAASNPVSDPTVDGIAAAYDLSNSVWLAPFYQFSDVYIDSANMPQIDTLDDDDPDVNDRVWSRENESSECLYLILATTRLHGKRAIDLIQSSRIGDTDGDGFLEILDAWGNPYIFIRNPVGLDNPAIKNFKATEATLAEQYPIDSDPLDLLLVDFRNYSNYRPSPDPFSGFENPYFPIYLPPVVISGGIDGEFGIRLSYFDHNDNGSIDANEAVPDSYSSSAVQIPGSGTTGMNPSDFQPIYFNTAVTPNASVPIARYPDPFVNISAYPPMGTNQGVAPNNAPYELSSEGIVLA